MPWKRIGIVALIVLVLDQATKYLVVEYLDLKSLGRIDVVDPFLVFKMAWNTGINFGLMDAGQDGRYILIGASIVIVLVVLFWTRHATGWIVPFATGLVVGGALGNVYDRMTYGAVADFINMSCCGFSNPFAFNVADVAIFLGAILLIIFAESPNKTA